ncbi:MAG: flagellar hook-basal body complex protein FliE [Gemmatimonadaceae bacterium]|nr:flagellar hook-basal body complex protein FliE [Gemmatimonadaceae bacterium]
MTAPINGVDLLARARALQEVQGASEGKAISVPVLREPQGASFGDTLTQALNQVSDAGQTSRDYVQAFLRGEPVELHQVMAASEEAGIAIDLLIQVRNKFLEAYKTVMNMST